MNQSPLPPIYQPHVELEARALHARVLAKDPIAFSELVDKVTGYLVMGVRRKFPKADDHDVETAAYDTLMSYGQNPGIYDPNRGAMINFLIMAARRDYQNLLAKEARHTDKYVSFEFLVADPDPEPEIEIELPGNADTAEQVLEQLRSGEIDTNIARLFPDLRDWNILYLMMLRVRDTTAYAFEMGIEDLPIEEQREKVKRTKDRIRALCRRHKSELLQEATSGSHD